MTRRRQLILVAAATLLWAGVPALRAQMATVSLIPAQHDVRILSVFPTTNFLDQDVLSVFNDGGNNIQHSLVQFDLTNLPDSNTIVAATLAVWRDSSVWTGGDNGVFTNVSMVTTPWVNTQVTWMNATTTTLWMTPGGDCDGPCLSSNRLNILNGTLGDMPLWFDVTCAVNEWYTGGLPNFGFCLTALAQPLGQPFNELHFRADRGGDVFMFPTLTIIYTPGF